jgi:hypothetical protein
VTGRHLDALTARRVVDEQVVRAGQGRSDDRSTRWAADQ